VLYNLKVTSNKRAPIYNNGVFSNTRPYHYSEIVEKEDVLHPPASTLPSGEGSDSGGCFSALEIIPFIQLTP
jgi:hypothetical protein